MNKKLTFSLLSGVLAAGVLAGCGDQDNDDRINNDTGGLNDNVDVNDGGVDDGDIIDDEDMYDEDDDDMLDGETGHENNNS
ncbi:hypothetical protein [Salipaludibacillus aurantiacus]|nr:hypothetical protein [Salipaludibacillus aurantiacus]